MIKKNVLIIFLILIGSNLYGVEDVWMRTDADASGFYLWFGGTSICPFTGKNLSHDIIYYPGINSIETEIGPLISFENLDLLPMLGVWYNATTGETEYLMPQLYSYYTHKEIYVETWNIFSYGTAGITKEEILFNGRYFIKISGLVEWLSLGPQFEFTYNFDSNLDESVTSMPVGGRFSFPYGENNSLDFFLGVETKNKNQITSRVTFMRYF